MILAHQINMTVGHVLIVQKYSPPHYLLKGSHKMLISQCQECGANTGNNTLYQTYSDIIS